ncbi:MAG: hypothetical protein CL608_23540 [Anaerolineaceae bacterium]|nr:hypothetical protein [Anaerolineaceae bacterium]
MFKKHLQKSYLIIIFISLFLILPTGWARTTSLNPVLVKDINPSFQDSSPKFLVNVNGTLFFRADDGIHGHELWKSDGTEAGTVMLKEIGTNSSYVSNLVNFNGTLLFTSNEGPEDVELWKSDGTIDGTVYVTDLPGYMRQPMVVNDLLFFITYDIHGGELWRTDGTASGTFMVKDIYPGAFSISETPETNVDLTNFNGNVFFRARNSGFNYELWKSDGTEAGTVMVTDIPYGGLYPDLLTVVGDTLYFAGGGYASSFYRDELWKSDGTTAGTVRVKDFEIENDSEIRGMINMNGKLLLSIYEGGAAEEGGSLWESDGTEAGTILLKDNLYTTFSHYHNLPRFKETAMMNGILFFLGISNDGTGLWKSDGTEAETVFVKEGGGGEMTVVDNLLFFRGSDDAHGSELWRSDGTTAGTVMVKDLKTGVGAGSWPSYLTEVNGTLFFEADDYHHGDELWKVSVSDTPAELDHHVYLPTILK